MCHFQDIYCRQRSHDLVFGGQADGRLTLTDVDVFDSTAVCLRFSLSLHYFFLYFFSLPARLFTFITNSSHRLSLCTAHVGIFTNSRNHLAAIRAVEPMGIPL